MSVERRGNRDTAPTVQRRGEKTEIQAPTQMDVLRQGEKAPDDFKQPFPSTNRPRGNAKFKGFPEFENRVEKRLREFKENPQAARDFQRRFRSRMITTMIAFFIITAIPPLAGFAVISLFGGLILSSLFPPIRSRMKAGFYDFAEAMVIASKLKSKS